jgi:hypothetical protein
MLMWYKQMTIKMGLGSLPKRRFPLTALPHLPTRAIEGDGAMKKFQSRRTKLPLFILFANMDSSHFEAKMHEQAKASNSESMIERKRYDIRKVPEACRMLKTLLDTIIAEGKVIDSEEIRYFLGVANEVQTEYRLQNGKIIEGYRLGTHWVLYPLWLRGLS